ncbi:hypothetical protein KSS87_002779 [Heliosperma pusillum]|nr:hypothetical protein KSS87_002779 [Heliosperma pusillum]
MRLPIIASSGFHLFVLLLVLHKPALALKQSYVVYMGAHSHGEEVSKYDLLQVEESHYELLGSYLGRTSKCDISVPKPRKKITYNSVMEFPGIGEQRCHFSKLIVEQVKIWRRYYYCKP